MNEKRKGELYFEERTRPYSNCSWAKSWAWAWNFFTKIVNKA